MINERAEIALDLKRIVQQPPISGVEDLEWAISNHPVPYEEALQRMESRAADIAAHESPEMVWLLEHPPLYTAGTSAQSEDLLLPDRFPVFQTGRGGQYTYHGPGQRIAYVMLDLGSRTQDVRRFVAVLEQWVINTLGTFGITGERREDRVGVWVRRPEKPPLPDGTMREDKIAAIGIRLRKWVSFHGISINVEPDLTHFDGIVPCGVAGHGVTSLYDLGVTATMEDVDVALQQEFKRLF